MKHSPILLFVLVLSLLPAFSPAEEAQPLPWRVPGEYTAARLQDGGRVEVITYDTLDYAGDRHVYQKQANVYLPPQYDENGQYDVLILCHGIGGNKDEWGLNNPTGKLKAIADNLILTGEVRPFIIVTPNGRAGDMATGREHEFQSFYLFGQELRSDLLPYIDSHYATYASGNEDLSLSRQHRAMAGLSMGGMQTINIGLCECADLFSLFGAFSAAPTSYTREQIARYLQDCPWPIQYFYNICGTTDKTAWASASAAAKGLPEVCDLFSDGVNFTWQELAGGHDFYIWYLGFYNFVRIVFHP